MAPPYAASLKTDVFLQANSKLVVFFCLRGLLLKSQSKVCFSDFG